MRLRRHGRRIGTPQTWDDDAHRGRKHGEQAVDGREGGAGAAHGAERERGDERTGAGPPGGERREDREPGRRGTGAPREEPPQPFERYWPRAGDEPITARSALGVRLVLAVLFTPLFLAGTALFWYWATQAGPGDVPGVDSLRSLTAICAGLSLFALTDLIVVLRRRRKRRPAGSR